MTDAERASRPGGRTARVRADVLAAVEAELAEHGYDGLTIDAVAARSGVHRTTVYRRWKTVAGLLVDLLQAGLDDTWEPADTGSLEGDLISLNREVYAALTARPSDHPGRDRGLLPYAGSRRGPDRVLVRPLHPQRSRRTPSRSPAANCRPTTDAHQLLMTATGPLYHQLVLLRQPHAPSNRRPLRESRRRGRHGPD